MIVATIHLQVHGVHLCSITSSLSSRLPTWQREKLEIGA